MADDLTAVINSLSPTAHSAEGTEIDHLPVVPQHGVDSPVVPVWAHIRLAHDVTSIIEPPGKGLAAAGARGEAVITPWL